MKPPRSFRKDFESYHDIRSDLHLPISADGLDTETLIRLYESKLVYLQNLRIKAFQDINGSAEKSTFSAADYTHILTAIQTTQTHLREVMVCEIRTSISRRKAG